MRACDIEFGDHDHNEDECNTILANMNPEPFYEYQDTNPYNSDSYINYLNRGY